MKISAATVAHSRRFGIAHENRRVDFVGHGIEERLAVALNLYSRLWDFEAEGEDDE